MNAGLIAAGLLVGILVGLTSAGGGSVMTPLLIYIGVPPLVAVGTDLLYSLPTKMFGWYLHGRQGSLRKDIVLELCKGGVPAACAGLALLSYLTRYAGAAAIESWVRHGVGVMVIVSAAMIAFAPLLVKRRQELEHSPAPLPRKRLWAIGGLVGFVVSLTSIGSGALALPLLALCVPGVTLMELVGSDIAFSTILVLIAGAGQWRMGHVDLGITLNLLGGSMLGVYLGSRLCNLGQRWVRPALVLVLAVAGSRLAV